MQAKDQEETGTLKMDPNKNRKEEGLEIRESPLSNPKKKSSELKKKPRKAETNPSQKTIKQEEI
ncbi:MAG: hypothetical protein IJS52_08820 [Bacilli bacterium]|nr:hypothetical protein [Bacilli bacterium]